MKKFISILLAMAMVLSLAACSGGGGDPPSGNNTPTTPPSGNDPAPTERIPRQGEYIWEVTENVRYKYFLVDGIPQPMGTSEEECYVNNTYITITETIMAYVSGRASAADEWGEWAVAPHYYAALECTDCGESPDDGSIPDWYATPFTHPWSGEWKGEPLVFYEDDPAPANNDPAPENPINDNQPDAPDISLAVAEGGEDEIAIRLTISDLQERIAAANLSDENNRLNIYVEHGDQYLYGFDLKERDGRIITFNGEHPLKIEGDTILLIFLKDGFTSTHLDGTSDFSVRILSPSGDVYAYFSNDEVIGTFEEVASAVNLSELTLDPSAISLKAKDNGDGTMTFTYTDATLKPGYIYNRSWFDIALNSSMFIECNVSAVAAGIDNAVIRSRFGVGEYAVDFGVRSFVKRGIGSYGWNSFYDNSWDERVLDLRREFGPFENDDEAYSPNNWVMTFDENGMTATWTEAYSSGYDADDIVAFHIDWWYSISGGDQGGHPHYFLNVEKDVFLEPSDVLE